MPTPTSNAKPSNAKPSNVQVPVTLPEAQEARWALRNVPSERFLSTSTIDPLALPPIDTVKQEQAERHSVVSRKMTHAMARAKVKDRIGTPLKTTQAVLKMLSASHHIWIDGIEPMPFDDFVCAIDENAPLTERQAKVFRDTNMNSAYSWVAPDRSLNEVVFLWGKGAGKDWLAAKVNSYVAYVVCHLEGGPAHYYRTHCGLQLARDTVLASLNVAPAGDLALETYFQYLLANLTHPLFDRFAPIIRTEAVKFCSPDELKKAKQGRREPIPFFVLLSKSSSASGLDGYNLICWVMDEADAFVNSDKKDNARLVHNILRSSCGTRMRNLWTGFVISYPRVKEGFMLKLYERAKQDMLKYGSDSQFYADLAATWEVRPSVSRDDPTIRSDYEDDPDEAAAKYECIPMEIVHGFFEMPEKIDASVEPDAEPVAYVTLDDYQSIRRSGHTDYYVRARIEGNITPTGGYEYFLGGDAGGYGKQVSSQGDAYGISVWHTDNQADGFDWICPRCANTAPSLLTGGRYVRQEQQAREAIRAGQLISCGVCYTSSAQYNGSYSQGSVSVAGWYKKTGSDESAIYDSLGRAYNVGHVYEDLLVQIKPVRKGNNSAVNRSVYFPAVQTLCRELIEKLPVAVSRFDPHQTADMTMGLRESTGGDIEEISFSNPEQYKRAKLAKKMLYAGLLHFLPNPIRDREWKRLVRINGNKIDHPDGAGESKDLYDVEAICIWLAVNRKVGSLELLFGTEQNGNANAGNTGE